ncbi:MAG: type I DNA topoisomerase [Patescibacteria group bacterium]
MNLVIVESPTKARKLKGYLGNEYVVEASVGHVRDLPEKNLGVDIENDFEPSYEVSSGKTKVVSQLKKLAKNAEKIYLAMDPDREGEAIAWHVQFLLSGQATSSGSKADPRFMRATFHEITKPAVLKAISEPGSLNLSLVDAQQARRVLDRLVGYKVSPVLWRKVRRGLSAGRVQSVALRLIAEREQEINAFKAEEYWEVAVGLSTSPLDKTPTIFAEGKVVDQLPSGVIVVELTHVQGKKFTASDEEQVKPIVADLKQADYTIEEIERKERRRQSLPPFTTSTMQQAAASRFGFSAKQTMQLAQELYEEGLITYHRTDSVNLASSALSDARSYIEKNFGTDYLPTQPRFFANKAKNAQEAHEAIRVTDVNFDSATIGRKSSRFGERHYKLYDLIRRRFLASQMEAAVYDQTSLIVLAKAGKNYKLRTSGSVMRFDGWTKLFANNQDTILPEVSQGQSLIYQAINPVQKFTQPPARYNDASLIKELEKRGIGRPSTYASIISVIVTRGYVERTDKKFWATPVGMAVNEFLIKNFAEMMNYDFTAEIEEDLDRVSLGKKQWKQVVREFYKPLSERIDKALGEADRVQIPVEQTGDPCPDCGQSEGGKVVIRTGRFGKFRSCSRFPDCKYTENIVEKIEAMSCPLCQKGEVVVKKTRWGKSFYGCGLYPECKWASWQKPEPGYTITAEEWQAQQAAREERKAKRSGRFGKKTSASSSSQASKKAKGTVVKKASGKRASTKTRAIKKTGSARKLTKANKAS